MSEPKMLFCVKCFASSRDSSWGGELLKELCCNCGCAGSAIELEEWQIQSIREQASWVGKRFYPHEEDADQAAELRYARARLPIPKDRYARLCIDETSRYWVTQPNAKGGTSVIVEASSGPEALEKSRTRLPLNQGEPDAIPKERPDAHSGT